MEHLPGSPDYATLNRWIYSHINISMTWQGSKFMVAMVANATMFSHLLPGCSFASKHLLLPKILRIVNLVHAFLCNVCNAILL